MTLKRLPDHQYNSMGRYMPDKLLDHYYSSDAQSSLLNLSQDSSIFEKLDKYFSPSIQVELFEALLSPNEEMMESL